MRARLTMKLNDSTCSCTRSCTCDATGVHTLKCVPLREPADTVPTPLPCSRRPPVLLAPCSRPPCSRSRAGATHTTAFCRVQMHADGDGEAPAPAASQATSCDVAGSTHRAAQGLSSWPPLTTPVHGLLKHTAPAGSGFLGR